MAASMSLTEWTAHAMTSVYRPETLTDPLPLDKVYVALLPSV